MDKVIRNHLKEMEINWRSSLRDLFSTVQVVGFGGFGKITVQPISSSQRNFLYKIFHLLMSTLSFNPFLQIVQPLIYLPTIASILLVAESTPETVCRHNILLLLLIIIISTSCGKCERAGGERVEGGAAVEDTHSPTHRRST